MIFNTKKLLAMISFAAVLNFTANANDTIPIAVIGGGCAGLSTAMVTSEYGFRTVLFSGPVPGGDLNVKTEVGNWPGIRFAFGNNIIPTLQKQAERFGTEIVNETITEADFTQSPFQLKTSSGQTIKAHKVVIATGTSERLLTIPGALENRSKIFYNSDVHHDLDRYMKIAKNKKIGIIGGGVDAMKKAFYALRAGAEEVHLFVRGPKLNLPPWRQKFVDKKSDKVKVHFNHDLSKIENLNQDHLRLHFNNQTLPSFDVEMLVVSIGRIPRSDAFKKSIQVNDKGLIITNPKTQETNIKGVFACGDVTDVSGYQPQAGIAAGDGMRAGYAIVDNLIAEQLFPQDSNLKKKRKSKSNDEGKEKFWGSSNRFSFWKK